MAPEFRFSVRPEEAYLVQELNIRAAANRDSLDKRITDNTVQDSITKGIATKVTAAKTSSTTDGGGKYARLIPRNQLLTARRRTKGGSILYIFIFDENSGQEGHPTDYETFTENELYTEVFNGALVQILQADGTLFDVIPIPEWDQLSVTLNNRTASGMYSAISSAGSEFNILSNLADYSIIYFVVDDSGSMTAETVETGIKEFFTDLTEQRVNRPQQRFVFQSSELRDTLAIPDTATAVGNWFDATDLESYLTSIDESSAYRSADTLLVMVSNYAEERAVIPAQEFFDWLGEEELEFYKTVKRA